MSTTSASTTAQRSKRRRESPVNWDLFYGGNNPADVIVIDDTPPPQAPRNGYTDREDPRYPTSKRRRATEQRSQQQYRQPVYDDHAYLQSAQNAYYRQPVGYLAPVAPVYPAAYYNGGTAAYYPAYVAAPVYAPQPQPPAPKRQRRTVQYTPSTPAKITDVYVRPINEPVTSNTLITDTEGHYIPVAQASLTTRYKIMNILGQGTFGKVVKCWDRTHQKYVAIKVIRAVQKYRDASKVELRVLKTLRERDPDNLHRCIHLRDCFDFRNHICIVTDLLGISVFDFLKLNSFIPFPPSHIQLFGKQLVDAVNFLHSLGLIHTDLKPENILLVNSEYREVQYQAKRGSAYKTRKILLNTEIRLIDFGSATFDDEYHSNVVSTRHYRAPEIIFGTGWSYACDMWSIGCILVEFHTGEALFQTHDNLEHLAMMEQICGKVPSRVKDKVQRSKDGSKFFGRDGKLDYPNDDTTRQSRKYVKAVKPLDHIIPPKTSLNQRFLDLLDRIFDYDTTTRIPAAEALKHAYFYTPVPEGE
ncbi:kinase-like protein [Saitoella complicata NRRL Y-17804]|uniref:kinase-like protein n=1 Tax=Saitoella complicata (strain BCRC 22490 / CBS 7301 / JCM 7358 / NBRC 10748 / NRRL Y-17804) TaxID=698492 RepID=UPI000866A57B|nr:kinase-like protein [Saitoella complicata NRRL Y-17804]ODQ54814.1 kinase-like protein [Saitoella complicata NRRL Y-17804]